jgi:hypothetical protein
MVQPPYLAVAKAWPMLSKTLVWKYVLPLLFVVALAGGVIGGLVVELAPGDHETGFS